MAAHDRIVVQVGVGSISRLSLFDFSGRLIKTFTVGAGPGDLHDFINFDVNPVDGFIHVYQDNQICSYDSNGCFLRSRSLPFSFYNFLSLPDGNFVFRCFEGQTNSDNSLADCSAFVSDSGLSVTRKLLSPAPRTSLPTARCALWRDGDAFLVSNAFSDTIFWSDGDVLAAKFILDYSSCKMPYSCLTMDFGDYMNFVHDNDCLYHSGDFVNNSTHLYLPLINNHRKSAFGVFVVKNSHLFTAGYNLVSDAEYLPSLNPPAGAFNDLFISVIPSQNILCSVQFLKPSSLISQKQIDALRELDADDNPVLALSSGLRILVKCRPLNDTSHFYIRFFLLQTKKLSVCLAFL